MGRKRASECSPAPVQTTDNRTFSLRRFLGGHLAACGRAAALSLARVLALAAVVAGLAAALALAGVLAFTGVLFFHLLFSLGVVLRGRRSARARDEVRGLDAGAGSREQTRDSRTGE